MDNLAKALIVLVLWSVGSYLATGAVELTFVENLIVLAGVIMVSAGSAVMARWMYEDEMIEAYEDAEKRCSDLGITFMGAYNG